MNVPNALRPDLETQEKIAERHLVNYASFLGLAHIARMAYQGDNLNAVFLGLQERLSHNPRDTNALMDTALILYVKGFGERALLTQKFSVQIQKNYTIRFGDGSDLKLLAFVTAGDLMANTPIEFLLEGTNVELTYHFVDTTTSSLNQVPEHDVSFFALGQCTENEPVLRNLERLLKLWTKPIINGHPELIRNLTRDSVSRLLASQSAIVAPLCVEMSRLLLTESNSCESSESINLAEYKYPLIVRPAGTHAGKGMQKIDNPEQMSIYLGQNFASSYYVCPFINYRSPDGFFRKQRIVFIAGQPYPCHQATSEKWMVHYLNADMEKFDNRRQDEANWFSNFPNFVERHKVAFQKLVEILKLDYFGIDCAETKESELLVFEIDVAMIVHSLDCEYIFPYKKPAMKRLEEGFLSLLRSRAELARAFT